MNSKIKNFFYPNSLAIVGASTKEKSIGYELLSTIKGYGYKGNLYPVNPKADEILGYKCFHSINEIEKDIDLAIVVVPKLFAEESIDMLLAKDVKSIILITAGFKEIGPEGEEMENRIIDKVKNAGARMVGPNCMGIINTLEQTRLNATFVAERPEKGKIAFLSQSGALGAAILNMLRESDIRFSHFISVGNKADMNENDLLKFWQEDNNISVSTYYLESFVEGAGFIREFMEGNVKKPTIILKAGRTASGIKAASSHTGALSSKDKVVEAMLDQFGIIRANDLNELFNTAKGFEYFPIPKGNRVAVITNAGGPAILAVDALEKEGLSLASFTEETREKLREIVHPEGSIANPVDLLPGGTADDFKEVNRLAAEDPNVDAVVSIFVEPVMVKAFEVIEGIYSIPSEKPIIQVCMPLPEFWNEYKENSTKNIPAFRNPEDPAEIISNMLFHAEKQKELEKNREEYLALLSSAGKSNLSASKGFIPQEEIQRICATYNLPITRDYIVSPDEIESFDKIDFPLVIKGINPEVVHKSELDAVKLNIKNREELSVAVGEVIASFAKGGYRVEGFLVQPFIETKHEVLLGGYRDPSFGPIIMFGSGGKYVEVFSDTTMKSAYLSDADIEAMINSTKMGKILRGVRGEKPIDMIKLKEIIINSAKMLIENERIAEFDFNPLIVAKDNSLHIVDARIKVE